MSRDQDIAVELANGLRRTGFVALMPGWPKEVQPSRKGQPEEAQPEYYFGPVINFVNWLELPHLVVRARTRFESGGRVSEVAWTPEWFARIAVAANGSAPVSGRDARAREVQAAYRARVEEIETSQEVQRAILAAYALSGDRGVLGVLPEAP